MRISFSRLYHIVCTEEICGMIPKRQFIIVVEICGIDQELYIFLFI